MSMCVASHNLVPLFIHIRNGAKQLKSRTNIKENTFCLKSPFVVHLWAMGGDFFYGVEYAEIINGYIIFIFVDRVSGSRKLFSIFLSPFDISL